MGAGNLVNTAKKKKKKIASNIAFQASLQKLLI